MHQVSLKSYWVVILFVNTFLEIFMLMKYIRLEYTFLFRQVNIIIESDEKKYVVFKE